VSDDGSSVVGVRGLQRLAPNIMGLGVLELCSEEGSKQAIVIAMS